MSHGYIRTCPPCIHRLIILTDFQILIIAMHPCIACNHPYYVHTSITTQIASTAISRLCKSGTRGGECAGFLAQSVSEHFTYVMITSLIFQPHQDLMPLLFTMLCVCGRPWLDHVSIVAPTMYVTVQFHCLWCWNTHNSPQGIRSSLSPSNEYLQATRAQLHHIEVFLLWHREPLRNDVWHLPIEHFFSINLTIILDAPICQLAESLQKWPAQQNLSDGLVLHTPIQYLPAVSIPWCQQNAPNSQSLKYLML